VTLSATESECQFVVNEIPNHDFHDGDAQFATPVSEQSGNYQITRQPQMAATSTALTLGVTNAIFLNGATVDLLAAACYGVGNEPLGQEKIGCGPDQIDNPWRYDPMSALNGFGTDSHNAHSQPDGTYHYHGDPRALYALDCNTASSASGVIGFAADGFPLFGPCIHDNGRVRAVRSSYVLKSGARQAVSNYQTPVAGVGSVASDNYDGQFRGDYQYQAGAGDLDECNGMTVDGPYGYYVTHGFPWNMNCYRGTVHDSFVSNPGAGAGPRARAAHSHDGHRHY
jgi:hypothetical protein